MESKKEFEKFLNNLELKNLADIAVSLEGVTKKCNQAFRKLDSDTKHRLNVGSIGRGTGIDGISDVDMIYELPSEMYERFNAYETNGQSALLQEVKDTLLDKYPKSDISADGQVVVFKHTNYKIEVLPAFLLDDGSYRYPDTNDGGSWKITKPKEESDELDKYDTETGAVLKNLCKMTRAWKNRNGVPVSGLLIDTLSYNFLKSNTAYHSVGFEKYGEMVKEFFHYLAEQDDEQEYWYAPGSNQKVYNTGKFAAKAKKAKKNCDKALQNEGLEQARKSWKKIFGRSFPIKVIVEKDRASYQDTEEYIEDMFPINIKTTVELECKVTQNGFRNNFLSSIPFLKSKCDLEFFVQNHNINGPFDLYWKVKNVGPEAKKRNMIRGQVVADKGFKNRFETSDFNGDHYVECFVVQNNTVIARDSIEVNIERHD